MGEHAIVVGSGRRRTIRRSDFFHDMLAAVVGFPQLPEEFLFSMIAASKNGRGSRTHGLVLIRGRRAVGGW